MTDSISFHQPDEIPAALPDEIPSETPTEVTGHPLEDEDSAPARPAKKAKGQAQADKYQPFSW